MSSSDIIQGIDASYATFAPHIFEQFKLERNCKVFVQDTWTGNAWPGGKEHCARNLAMSLGAGFYTAPYINIWGARSHARYHIDRGREPVGDMWPLMNYIEIDVETDSVDINCIIEAARYVIELHQRPVIYISPDFWNNHVQGRTESLDRELVRLAPLLKASWGPNGTPSSDPNLRGMGPWASAMGHQYSGSYSVYGVDVDLNIFDRRYIEEGAMLANILRMNIDLAQVALRGDYQLLVAKLKYLGVIR